MGFGFIILLLTLALLGAAFWAFKQRSKHPTDATPPESTGGKPTHGRP